MDLKLFEPFVWFQTLIIFWLIINIINVNILIIKQCVLDKETKIYTVNVTLILMILFSLFTFENIHFFYPFTILMIAHHESLWCQLTSSLCHFWNFISIFLSFFQFCVYSSTEIILPKEKLTIFLSFPWRK